MNGSERIKGTMSSLVTGAVCGCPILAQQGWGTDDGPLPYGCGSVEVPRAGAWGSDKRWSLWCSILVVNLLLLAPALPARAQDTSPVERFIASLDDRNSVPQDARKLIRDQWVACDECDAEEFLTQGLAVLSAKLRAVLDAYDSDDYSACASIAGELSSSDDPFLAVHGAVYEIKAFIAWERLLEAHGRIQTLVGGDAESRTRVATFSYFLPEMDFLQGLGHLADLQYDAAVKSFEMFLEEYPDAPQRLTVSARQMLMELSNRQPGSLGDVADLMTFSGRRLGASDSGEMLQARQQEVLDLLDALIDAAKQSEKKSKSDDSEGEGGQPKPQPAPGGGQGDMPNSPMQDSSLPGGQAQMGQLNETRRANPGEMWGAMPPAQREKILQAIRESFPSRYRKLVEQYYEELAKKP